MTHMQYAGHAYDKGEQIWINIGWNSTGNQRIPGEVPSILADSVEDVRWKAFVSDLRPSLAANTISVPGCLQCPCGFCILCPYACAKKAAFDAAMTQATERHKANLPGLVGWKLVHRARKEDPNASMGYNIIFLKSGMPQGSRGMSSMPAMPVVVARVVGDAPAQEQMVRTTTTQQIEEINSLLERGLITQEEFTKKKALILGLPAT
ncbi:unnamed protein product [Symbiodinium pilosum]|uniref:SHOCT domain-containing protein n=1 Tax=Symbiodinium pilosum TaxID=2952 RepID=A0A812XAB0_SYMPI|nr:unnamed protein product [Symbiodinium pilosum]